MYNNFKNVKHSNKAVAIAIISIWIAVSNEDLFTSPNALFLVNESQDDITLRKAEQHESCEENENTAGTALSQLIPIFSIPKITEEVS